MNNRKWVLITGASTGIGRACANYLANNGFNVFGGVRNQKDFQDLAKLANIHPLNIDVTIKESIQNAYDKIKSQNIDLYALINNAGIARAGPLMDLPIQDLREQFDVNLFGVHRMTRKFFPLLNKKIGRIIMMSSDSGFFATPFFGPYCASKFALEGYSDSLRRELLLCDMKVILIQPGRVNTPIWDKGKELLEREGGSIFMKFAKQLGKEAIEKGKTKGLPSRDVAKVVHKALTKKNPKLRYLIAPSIFKYRLIKLLPEKWVDKMVKKEFNRAEKKIESGI
ncbi:MAG: SDR family oxidoreductase [Promethearchaeota archaeon]|nr:MAG: SDR family oxidoreductase [Candidatus Lokiarchaeota archaeon]